MKYVPFLFNIDLYKVFIISDILDIVKIPLINMFLSLMKYQYQSELLNVFYTVQTYMMSCNKNYLLNRV